MEKLKAMRLKRGLSQEQLAKRMNTTQAAISRYERSDMTPYRDALARLCAALQCAKEDIVSENEGRRAKRRVSRRTAPGKSSRQWNRLPWLSR
jgi:transcriptional regulator with XRE-family HTH domain